MAMTKGVLWPYLPILAILLLMVGIEVDRHWRRWRRRRDAKNAAQQAPAPEKVPRPSDKWTPLRKLGANDEGKTGDE